MLALKSGTIPDRSTLAARARKTSKLGSDCRPSSGCACCVPWRRRSPFRPAFQPACCMKPKPIRPQLLTPAGESLGPAVVRDAVNDPPQVLTARPGGAPARHALSLAKIGPPAGRLDWRMLIDWLREDGVISADDAERTRARFAGADSAQHPLVRLGERRPDARRRRQAARHRGADRVAGRRAAACPTCASTR